MKFERSRPASISARRPSKSAAAHVRYCSLLCRFRNRSLIDRLFRRGMARAGKRRRTRQIKIASLMSQGFKARAQLAHSLFLITLAVEVLHLFRIVLQIVKLPLFRLLPKMNQLPAIGAHATVFARAMLGGIFVIFIEKRIAPGHLAIFK